MRTLALILIFLNCSFLVWQLGLLTWLPWQPNQFAPTSWSEQPSDLPALVLLSERNLENFEKVAATKMPQVKIIPTSFSQITNQKPVTSSTTFIDKVEIASISEQPRPKFTPKIPETPIKKISSVSKLQQAAGLAKNSKNHKKIKDKDQSFIPTESCFQASLYTRTKVSQITNWLKNKKDIIYKVQSYPKQILAATWVYLPPYKNRQIARQVRQHLNQIGITHHELVTKGQFNNAISLGLFRKSSNVKNRIQKLKTLGYQNVKTQKRYKNNTNYRLNVKILAGQNELLDISQKNFWGARLKPVNCQAIALPQ